MTASAGAAQAVGPPGVPPPTRSPRCAPTTTESEPPVSESTTAPRRPGATHSHGSCGTTWTATGAAHCSGCCNTFSGVSLFDRHRSLAGEHGTCTHPADLRDRDGNPICEFRDGMWRYPEMTDDQKAARFGTVDAA